MVLKNRYKYYSYITVDLETKCHKVGEILKNYINLTQCQYYLYLWKDSIYYNLTENE